MGIFGRRSFTEGIRSTKKVTVKSDNQQTGQRGQSKWQDKCREQLCDRSGARLLLALKTQGVYCGRSSLLIAAHRKKTDLYMQLHNFVRRQEGKGLGCYKILNKNWFFCSQRCVYSGFWFQRFLSRFGFTQTTNSAFIWYLSCSLELKIYFLKLSDPKPVPLAFNEAQPSFFW